jgi:hypothetical protein
MVEYTDELKRKEGNSLGREEEAGLGMTARLGFCTATWQAAWVRIRQSQSSSKIRGSPWKGPNGKSCTSGFGELQENNVYFPCSTPRMNIGAAWLEEFT